MKIIITGRQIDVDEDLKSIITKKVSRLDKFFSDDAVAYVTLAREKSAERLELTVSTGGTLFRAEQSEKTFRDALDTDMDIIERQIRKNKTRLSRRLREGALKTLDVSGETKAAPDDYVPVRRKTVDLIPMTTEDAVMQMELLNHEFYMFRNVDDGRTEVVYKRKNGGYGILIPSVKDD